jgi:uncharacterized lipoprotein YmbA
MNTKLSVLLILLVGLSGCATSATPIEYYVLSPASAQGNSVVELPNRPTLLIENVALAAYLKQSGMIIQTGDNQLQVSKNHLWAESLDLALPKALVRELQKQSDQYSYYLKNVDWVGETDYRLRVHFDSLQSTDQGEVVSSGRYQLISAVDPSAAVFVRFNFNRPIQQDGYENAVVQMNLILGELAAAIVDTTNKLAQQQATPEIAGEAGK